METTEVYAIIENKKCNSAWNRGVKQYALELLEDLENQDEEEIYSNRMLKKQLLNGAQDWKDYSEGGCALIYDKDIAKRLCTPSELKRTDGGRLMPNNHENWIDAQSRALFQAYHLIKATIKEN